MKKFIGILCAVVLMMFVSACAETEIENENTLDIVGEKPVAEMSKAASVDAAAEENETEESLHATEYSYGYTNMSIDLPDGWSCDVVACGADADCGDTQEEAAGHYGLMFWPDTAPELVVELYYYVEFYGMCGTGVTFEDIILDDGSMATKCSETIGESMLMTLIYEETPGRYIAHAQAPMEVWDQHEEQVMSILSAAQLGVGVMKPAQAIEIADAERDEEYEWVLTEMDFQTGQWEVKYELESDRMLLVYVEQNGEISNVVQINN